MIKVAITGNIASGKSQVENILIALGFKVADTDKINHSILIDDNSAIEEIKQAFTDYDVLDENGNISRQKLGSLIFSDFIKKRKLEEILHKRINIKVEEFFVSNSAENIVFVSIPLLFETNQQNKFDKIIFVSAPESLRLSRLVERNNYTFEYAKTRIASQDSEESKIKKSDFVIYNNSDLISLKKQVVEVLKNLTSL